MYPPLILIVEPDSGVRGFAHRVLAKAGFRVLESESIERAWHSLHGRVPSAAIVGVQHANASGDTVITRMRKAPITKDVPVILLSQVDFDPQFQIPRLDGRYYVMGWAYRPAELVALVWQVIREHVPQEVFEANGEQTPVRSAA